ncbi:UDP-N-acetylmuramoyl-L-alanine--D-glutamate ligase [Corynebacterium yonathiae]|uniref:UDP-N-acetylmuramoylalanine--D-glutamate ligase n=1 Tax=Corynebacterium yonathiae TaxID=2913504 RepID=A0A9X3LX57_9CORY|nr:MULTISPECIES: UDP-N-acetylmuramoyl-L-alanine--D-glutamate ligase [Corynebacterium]MCZ9295659.1 UDP-N-acetylmuramoyl-L-alanine--D-glutamate ligase [Corynebacterium yonathiae]MDK2582203.1 UDP-N-acetylmuramoyl-L-alanine--D-glutamate ligase [Corynebacterium sp. BWA136]
MTELPASLRGRVLVAGAGVSGRGCVAMLTSLGVDTTVADSNQAALEALAEDYGVATLPVDSAAQSEFDLVVTSPGWRPDSPLLLAFQNAGVEVIGDVELAYRLDRSGVFGAPRTWLVVTGTNGKTTTTGMLAKIMQADAARTGKRALAVGNIGVSLFDALTATPRVDVLCAELSSFQLHWSSQLRPDVGVLLNLAEDHLDWHGSFDAYAQDKAKVLGGQAAVVGKDDAAAVGYAAGTADLYGFTAAEPAQGEVGVSAGRLISRLTQEREDLASAEGIEPAGLAGVLDAAAAASVARLAGATPQSIAQGLAAYTVAGHRGAVVHEHAGITFIDNSKATNPHAADAALKGLNSVVWVAGGQLKGAEVDGLVAKHAAQIKAAVVMGVDREEIAHALAEHAPHAPVDVIESSEPSAAMNAAVRAALQHAEAGDTVLLAPAAASLDMYTGMAQRGDFFAAAARELTPQIELEN